MQTSFINIGGRLNFALTLVDELQPNDKACGRYSGALGFLTKDNVIVIDAGEVACAYSQFGTIIIDCWMTGIDKVFGHEGSFGVA